MICFCVFVVELYFDNFTNFLKTISWIPEVHKQQEARNYYSESIKNFYRNVF